MAKKKIYGKHQFVDAKSSYRSIRDCQGGVCIIRKDKGHRQCSNNWPHFISGKTKGNQERKG